MLAFNNHQVLSNSMRIAVQTLNLTTLNKQSLVDWWGRTMRPGMSWHYMISNLCGMIWPESEHLEAQ